MDEATNGSWKPSATDIAILVKAPCWIFNPYPEENHFPNGFLWFCVNHFRTEVSKVWGERRSIKYWCRWYPPFPPPAYSSPCPFPAKSPAQPTHICCQQPLHWWPCHAHWQNITSTCTFIQVHDPLIRHQKSRHVFLPQYFFFLTFCCVITLVLWPFPLKDLVLIPP